MYEFYATIGDIMQISKEDVDMIYVLPNRNRTIQRYKNRVQGYLVFGKSCHIGLLIRLILWGKLHEHFKFSTQGMGFMW